MVVQQLHINPSTNQLRVNVDNTAFKSTIVVGYFVEITTSTMLSHASQPTAPDIDTDQSETDSSSQNKPSLNQFHNVAVQFPSSPQSSSDGRLR
jgi:hypothetical protein